MKKILFSLAAGLVATVSSAQLQSGSVCPDFTGTDLDGNTWNLYDLLDEGYSVVIDVSATWCPPCWDYHHNDGELEDLYTLYGPDGTNELRVFFIEGDAQTTLADLNGTGGNTLGDWVTGTSYPIIDDATIGNLLEIAYFPTIYTVCPSRIITETSQITTEEHYAFVQQNACGVATLDTDPALINISINNETCSGNVDLNVALQNFGITPLVEATILITGGTSNVTYNWTGNLDTYEISNIAVGTITTDGTTTLSATVTSTDGDILNSTAEIPVELSVADATTHIKLDWLFDNWPQEASWKITDEGNVVVASAGVGSYPQITYAESPLLIDVYLPATGCYKFTYTDLFGDGLFGSQWGNFINGHCYVYGVASDGTQMDYIYNYDGSYNIGNAPATEASVSKLANVNEVVSLKENLFESQFSVSPNPTADQVNVKFNLESSAVTTISVTNILGQVVSNMTLGKLATGVQNQVIDLSALEAGIYQITINAGNSIGTKKVTLVK